MSRKQRKIRVPDFILGLSRPPGDAWPEQLAHHGARAALLLFLAVALSVMFPWEGQRTTLLLDQGPVATRDIVAEIPFDVLRNDEELEAARAEVAAAQAPIYTFRREALDTAEAQLERFFDSVSAAAAAGDRGSVQRVLVSQGIVNTTQDQVDLLLNPANLRAMRDAARELTRELAPQYLGYRDPEYLPSGGSIEVRDSEGGVSTREVDGLLGVSDLLTEARYRLGTAEPGLPALFNLVLLNFLRSPFDLDLQATNQVRTQAANQVSPLKTNVLAGEVIVRQGERIGPDEEQRILAYEEALRAQGLLETGRDWRAISGSFLLDLVLLSIFGLLIYFFRREVYGNFRWVLLQALLVLAYFVGVWGVVHQGFPPELLPVTFAILPVAVLWDGRMALVLALILAVLTGIQPPFVDTYVLLVTLVGGCAAALSARAIRRRSQTWIFIALITLGYSLAIVALGLLGLRDPGWLPRAILFAAGNATAAAILAMGFMPVFEWFTGITTDQTLLEWADPNRPLLKRLSMEAGGTYAHTINVANLAEAAATAIGANGLLVRVGIYYHDVGKMLKPQFFVENQPGARNPHDKLKPQTSAAIVKEHVIEGEKMARAEGVPDVVARFIPEHHGTQLIGFFYDRAKQESEEPPDPEAYRYPGPKPQSKETAIAMLADSVESATRALQDPSPERIKELVQTIVNGKIRDGQLSESPLTLREISVIQDRFAKAVMGMFHHRIDYPETRHLTGSNGSRAAAQGPARTGEKERAEGDRARPSQDQLPLEPAPESPDTPPDDAR